MGTALPGCWLSLVLARAAGGAAVRGEGEPEPASKQVVVGGAAGEHQAPQAGVRALGCSYRDLLCTNLELVQPALPPGAPFWVCPCPAGPGGGNPCPGGRSLVGQADTHCLRELRKQR